MGGQAVRPSGGRVLGCTAALSAVVLLSAYPTIRLSAQVGHPPDHSPYRELRRGHTLVLSVGRVGGGKGVVGVGPTDGNVWALRFEKSVLKKFALTVEAGNALTSRLVLDPTKDSLTRASGPVSNDLIFADVGLHLVFTGGKTWHGLAPSLGFVAGVAAASRVPGDSSYSFRTKGLFGPQAGLRFHLSPRLALRADARLAVWRLTYPLAYRTPSPVDGSRILAVTSELTEWTRHPWFSVGVAWTL